VTLETDAPTIYVVVGPNDAGKTTFSREFLPNFARCDEFLNADLIAAGLSPFAPQTQDLRAAELMLLRMDECVKQGKTFGFETTLAGRRYVSRLREAKSKGYRVITFFLWLPDAKMAISRVAQRTKSGGHFVPDDTVNLRYGKGLSNFRDLYRMLSDSWQFYDASELPPLLIATGAATLINVVDHSRFRVVSQWISP
jgi:predicted ABC-type ATPase